jgi:hypothetical protein
MAELSPSRDVARPRNVAGWMLDRLDEYTSMPAGSTYAKMPYDEVLDEARLSELRRQQAAFNEERRRVDREPQNRILAYGALAAPALFLGSELIEGFGFPAARAIGRPAEFNIPPARRALNPKEKGVVGGGGRQVFERANGMSASQMGTPPGVRGARGGNVHHRTPNAHANKLPGADPNRLENLQGVPEDVHSVVTAEQAKLLKSLGRQPTPAEIELFRQRMDRFIEPYTLRRGLPRPPPRLKKPPS